MQICVQWTRIPPLGFLLLVGDLHKLNTAVDGLECLGTEGLRTLRVYDNPLSLLALRQRCNWCALSII